jgi:DNA-binding winged helix-turn-helix (wHTH) protein
LLWGPNYPQKYSNWALDKFISKIRGKLKSAGIDKDVIHTISKEGYKLTL